MLQRPHLCGPSLHLLQQFHVLVLVASELDAGFQVGSHERRVERQNHFPYPAGHTCLGATQVVVGLLLTASSCWVFQLTLPYSSPQGSKLIENFNREEPTLILLSCGCCGIHLLSQNLSSQIQIFFQKKKWGRRKKSTELTSHLCSLNLNLITFLLLPLIYMRRICEISRVCILICKADHPSCYKFGLMKLLSCTLKEVERRKKENPSPFFLICFPVIMLFGCRYENCRLGKPDLPVLCKDSADAVYHMMALSQLKKKRSDWV